MKLGEAATPEGMRLYAIGDVHGRLDLLKAVHDGIKADLEAKPAKDFRVIHVGDYVDRGPDSAGVVAMLIERGKKDKRVLCLGGNHEDVLLGFLADPTANGRAFMRFGGPDTIVSYGLAAFVRNVDELPALRDRFAAILPPEHIAFLKNLPRSVRFGDYFFCHAGIRPGVPLDAQSAQDLIWIREDFLKDNTDHGVVVIHGHTPAEAPEVRPNRIGIDTEAYASGRLTCLVLDGKEYRFL